MASAFDLLAEPIRRVLWDLRWTELRPIQDAAIQVILETESDLIISARTASGKTEAAFLPVLSAIHAAPTTSVRAVYVGPLKALINDQFRRLEELCQHAEIPVHRWHGDVTPGNKRRLLMQPSGVLLITPESLESLFINHSPSLAALFRTLSFVVIDELHALQGRERGTHLRSLLYRLRRVTEQDFRLIALSATVGDPELAAQWMRRDEPGRVRLLGDDVAPKSVRFGIFACEHAGATDDEANAESEEDASGPPSSMIDDLYEAFRSGKGLVFANQRSDVEWFADALNERAAAEGLAGQFLVHHGSLSKEVREHTESQMQGRHPYTTLCTSTLELGIDIGNVATVGQIGCPFSVASLTQRIGRSGRRDDQPQVMRLYLMEERLPTDADLCTRLRPQLLQAVALTELMRARWVEPPEDPRGDLSTLVQQILSVIKQTGGRTAADLFDQLVARGAFRDVPKSVFLDVLRSSAEHDLIDQASDATLLLGMKGERIVGHYDFYSAFASPEEFRVVHQGTPLGSLPASSIPPIGHHLLLAGRRWKVAAIDQEQREIAVIPGHGRKPPRFEPTGGAVHREVRRKMGEVLLGDAAYPYLNAQASDLLSQARTLAIQAGLHRGSLLALSPSRTLWFTWTGSKQQNTLMLMAARHRLHATDHDIAIELRSSTSDVVAALGAMLLESHDPTVLASLHPYKQQRKYDWALTDELLTWALATESVDVEGALEVIQGTLG